MQIAPQAFSLHVFGRQVSWAILFLVSAPCWPSAGGSDNVIRVRPCDSPVGEVDGGVRYSIEGQAWSSTRKGCGLVSRRVLWF